ncbi:MAG TPA: hypothetical protein VE338_19180 [Ktedonobacterales bacterium]|jgi:hypothetical protein|nr:hypothetical protein [Ktedonobacterales bacterium]
MLLTTVRIERPEGTVIARGVAVQIEEASPEEKLSFDGARPYDLIAIYTTQGVPLTPIRRRDVLYDEVNTDPETGALAKYRVAGAVETFANDHQEMIAERVVGG